MRNLDEMSFIVKHLRRMTVYLCYTRTTNITTTTSTATTTTTTTRLLLLTDDSVSPTVTAHARLTPSRSAGLNNIG